MQRDDVISGWWLEWRNTRRILTEWQLIVAGTTPPINSIRLHINECRQRSVTYYCGLHISCRKSVRHASKYEIDLFFFFFRIFAVELRSTTKKKKTVNECRIARFATTPTKIDNESRSRIWTGIQHSKNATQLMAYMRIAMRIESSAWSDGWICWPCDRPIFFFSSFILCLSFQNHIRICSSDMSLRPTLEK